MFPAPSACRHLALVAFLSLSLSLSACGRGTKEDPPPSGETFGAGDTYSRTYDVQPAVACESARRALLGQGYVIARATGDAVEATKSFQPDADVHTQLNVRATCVSQAGGGSIVFVNAVQDRYALKTTANSASVGVSMIGSISLPVGSSGANLVRVASNTVQNQDFYRRLFERVKTYLAGSEGALPPPPPPEQDTPPDPAAPAATGALPPPQVEPGALPSPVLSDPPR